MKLSYSIYEAKAKLSEMIRQVKMGRRITITERGREVARVVPIEDSIPLEQRVEDLTAAGILAQEPEAGLDSIRLVARRRGALDRFLDERDR